MFYCTRYFFLLEAFCGNQTVPFLFTTQDILDLMAAPPLIDSLSCLIWTATFFVKFSFLALFKGLIGRVSRRIDIYYWIVVVFTMLSWLSVLTHPFLFCKFGKTPSKGIYVHRKSSLPLLISPRQMFLDQSFPAFDRCSSYC